MEWLKGSFKISTDQAQMDVRYIHQYLSAQSYWASSIPLPVVEKSIENSLCFGVFHEQRQIGFARMITDRATFAYLADVFIDEAFRGQGLSKWLMEVIMAHPELQGLRMMMLATRDAHGLYRKYGFTELSEPKRWMGKHFPNVYRTT